MIFQRGNPLDFERWAADPGMETGTTRTACRTSSAWRTAWRRRRRRSAGTTGRSCSSAARRTSPLFEAFFEAVQQAGYAAHRRRQRLPPGRLRPPSTATCTAAGGCRAARAYLHPVMSRPQPRRSRPARSSRKIVFEGTRAVGVEYRRAGGARSGCERARCILCGGAINSPQLLQLSGVGAAAELARARHRRGARPARRRREPAGPPRGVHPARVHAAGVDGARTREVAQPAVDRDAVAVRTTRPGRDQPLRGGRLRAQQRRGALPEPDVPLPADRDPLRRLAPRRRRARLPGAHRPDVLGLARLGEDRVAPTRASKPALRFNYLSTEQDRREWVEAIRVARAASSTSRRSTPFNGGETLAGPGGGDRRADPRLGATRRRDRAAPVVHVPRWAPTTMSVVDPLTMRVHGARRAARRRRLGRCRTSPTATSTRR